MSPGARRDSSGSVATVGRRPETNDYDVAGIREAEALAAHLRARGLHRAMRRTAGLREKIAAWRPRVGTAFLTYLDLEGSDVSQPLDDRYSFKVVESSADPLLGRFAPRWQRRFAGPRLDAGDWYALVILEGDKVIGHFWAALRPSNNPLSGAMRIRLRQDEAYGFDLYLNPDHRRGSIGTFVADATISELKLRGVRVGYTHVLFDNPASVLWHDSIGFNWVQMFNYINIGPRIWWKLPFSESPRYGPLSRRGRHNEADPQMPFGGALIPK